MEQLKIFGRQFSWNEESDMAPILPMVHGTSFDVARKICDTGFSNLSLLDAGYYGRGMYFTRSGRYALPYYATKQQPAILICLTIPGNSFPVVEHRNEEKSFLGRAIPSGYQSNYVLTTKDGNPCKNPEGTFYDELVIEQEVQVVPLFLLTFDAPQLRHEATKFNREVIEPNRDEKRAKVDVKRAASNVPDKKKLESSSSSSSPSKSVSSKSAEPSSDTS
jgi:hypothetical protein